MIWHVLEVWFVLAVAFTVGCVMGALLYGAIAQSRFAPAQGALADEIGDVVDGIKARLGLGAVWRPQHLRAIERPVALPEPETAAGADDYDYENEPALVQDPGEIDWEETSLPDDELPPPPERLALAPPRVASDQPADISGDPVRVESASAVGEDGVVPMRPAGLSGPRGGVPDNLTRIRGIGGRNEALLNSLGIFHFGQIAAWTPGEVRWIGQYLAFPERIERDDWVAQAMVLASGGDTGFEKSAERRRRRRRSEQQTFLARQVAAGVSSVMRGEPAPAEEEPPVPSEDAAADGAQPEESQDEARPDDGDLPVQPSEPPASDDERKPD